MLWFRRKKRGSEERVIVVDVTGRRILTPVTVRDGRYFASWSAGYLWEDFELFKHGVTSSKPLISNWKPFVSRWEPVTPRMHKFFAGYIGA